MSSKPNILICPLNWGLGHATRCIPIIDALIAHGAEVVIASDGPALDLLKKEYPALSSHELPLFDIQYPSSNMAFNMLSQFNKIRKAIRNDHRAIQGIVRQQNIQAIISDNRYGCFSDAIYNVFMSHQLNIKAPFRLAEKLIGRWNKKMIQPFDLCWVPDYEEAPRLSGNLSFPSPISKVRYIGALSRFEKEMQSEIDQDVLVVLSGPEPQRTFLEKAILEQAQSLPHRFLVVRGRMEDDSRKQVASNIEVIGHLTARALNKAINRSKYIVSRSGYSTIMDLATLEKQAILIPTPGQTEQEYLSRHFHEKGIFFHQSQKDLNIKKALEEVESFDGISFNKKRADDLGSAISSLIEQFD